MSFAVEFNTLEELKTKIQGNNSCYKSEDAREGLVKFCEMHPEIEFVEAIVSGYDYFQWEIKAELLFKNTFHGETEPTLIDAHWCQMG